VVMKPPLLSSVLVSSSPEGHNAEHLLPLPTSPFHKGCALSLCHGNLENFQSLRSQEWAAKCGLGKSVSILPFPPMGKARVCSQVDPATDLQSERKQRNDLSRL
jgi:hypothetical protein